MGKHDKGEYGKGYYSKSLNYNIFYQIEFSFKDLHKDK